MHGRRCLLIGLAAVACTASKTEREAAPGAKPEPPARPAPELLAGEALLALVQWPSGGGLVAASLAVYASGRLDVRTTVEAVDGNRTGPLLRRVFRIATAPPAWLEQLRENLADADFRNAETSYIGDVPHGFSSILLAPQVGHSVASIGMPRNVPTPVANALLIADSLLGLAKEEGVDAFAEDAPADGRLLLVHTHDREREGPRWVLSVFDNGAIEYRKLWGPDGRLVGTRESPLPYSVTRRLPDSALAKLRGLVDRVGGDRDHAACDPTLGCEHELVTARIRLPIDTPTGASAQALIDEALWLVSDLGTASGAVQPREP